MPNFLEPAPSITDIAIFRFSKWRLPPSWIFKFVKFHWRGPRFIIVLNVVKIDLSIAEILQFFEFSRWPPPPCWIFEITQFYWLAGFRGSDASACQILSKSVNRLRGY